MYWLNSVWRWYDDIQLECDNHHKAKITISFLLCILQILSPQVFWAFGCGPQDKEMNVVIVYSEWEGSVDRVAQVCGGPGHSVARMLWTNISQQFLCVYGY